MQAVFVKKDNFLTTRPGRRGLSSIMKSGTARKGDRKKLMESYDIIVVGAGNGGLAAAAVAARQGMKVLLLEKHSLVGGCATSFVRGRFEFEPSLHELGAVRRDGTGSLNRLFDQLGEPIDWCIEDELFRCVVTGQHDVVLPAGEQPYIDALEKAVPGCRGSLEKLFAVYHNCEEGVAYATSAKKINGFKMITKYADFMACASHSAKEVMDACGVPPRAQDIIATNWGYLGLPIDEINAFHFFSMLFELVENHPSMPARRSHELSMALADAVLKNGGEIRCLSPVSRFLYDAAGNAAGVVCRGEEIRAKKIIADINPHSVYALSDPDQVPRQNAQVANARKFGLSFIVVYLGLDASADELGLKNYSTFVSDSADTRKQYAELGRGIHYSVNCLNRGVPNATPEGTSMLTFTIGVYEDIVPQDLTPQQYKAWKNGQAEKYIKDYEQRFHVPLREHIEEISVATPVTFARYLGSPHGTVYGYDTSAWDNIMARRSMEDSDNAIGNLRFVGSGGWMGDGYGCAYSMGAGAAAKAVAEIRGEEVAQ